MGASKERKKWDFRKYVNSFFPNESTQIYTHSWEKPHKTDRQNERNNPPNPQTNPKHLHLQMSPVRSSKILPPRTRKSLNDRRRSQIPCYMVLGDLGPEMHEGMLFFFCTVTRFAPRFVFGLVWFWFSFLGSLAGCEVSLHFLACRRSREDRSPFTATEPTPCCLTRAALSRFGSPISFCIMWMVNWSCMNESLWYSKRTKWVREACKHLIIKREMRVFTLRAVKARERSLVSLLLHFTTFMSLDKQVHQAMQC